jgi:hypothetical protein
VIGSKSEFVEQIVDVDYSLDIFEVTIKTSEPSKEIFKTKLLI